MTWKLAPAVLLLAAALVALGQVFARERNEAVAEIEGRHRALEQYAEAALSRRLHELLAAAEPRIDAASKDPLVDAEGTFLLVDGVQVLPPRRPNESPPLAELDDDDEANERPYLAQVMRASTNADVERAVRGLLAHRARWKVPVQHDSEVVLAVAEHLGPRANPALLQGLLRDGFPGQDGVQRQLLRARGRLPDRSFSALCLRTARVSRLNRVAADDFEARCHEPWVPASELPVSTSFPVGPSREGPWYLESTGAVTRGIRVDFEAERLKVADQMSHLGMSGSADSTAAIARAHALFRLKAGLLLTLGLLGAGAAALLELTQRRKRRFLTMREDFVAAVSHELKTPLASMRVMAETLQLRLAGHSTAKDYPQRLVSEIDGLHTLVENILSFNRLDKGRLKPQRAPFKLATLIGPLQDDAQTWPAPVHLSFHGFESVTLDADAELLKLCLLNLLRNACRYNSRSPIEVSFRWDEGTLFVEDNGVGIPPADWTRVFDDFVRLKSPQAPSRAGTGLGLALCRRVMAMHGGSIGVERSGPQGTTFALRFAL